MSSDKTVRKAPSDTTRVRPSSPLHNDPAHRRAADQTALLPQSDEAQIRDCSPVDPTQCTEPSGDTRQHDNNATIRIRPQPPDTAARTLQAPAHAATLQAPATGPEGAQDMRNRLATSLDEAGEGHHGALQPGSVINKRFVLETVLGKGGMGVVFSAIDRRKEEARDPNPRVALKLLNAEFQRHPQSFVALQREARKAQTLAHPNVATVFDFDRDGDAVYMTMEMLKGRTLDSMLREVRGKGVGREIALPIIRGVAEGLAWAHRKNIIHADLKPANIFITEDGVAKILDFGIARAVPGSVTEENPDGFDAGSFGAYTEAYATDEMVDGVDPHPADDLYALGIIAYELVTGVHPYQRHSAPRARTLGIRPPPIRGLRRKQAHAIESCLSFDRRQRPQNASEFLKAFRGVTALQQATLAATVVLALLAGYLWYQNYLETSPAIPLAQLSGAQQREFRENMRQGDRAWTFYQRDHISDGLQSAIEFYATAWEIHPRNRAAVAALNRAADALLDAAGDDADQRREFSLYLQRQSSHFRKYPPVVEAAQRHP